MFTYRFDRNCSSVVNSIATVFASTGTTVLLYNTRGTSSSTGKASWNGEAERRDFGAVVEWFLEQEWTRMAMKADSTTLFCCVSQDLCEHHLLCSRLTVGNDTPFT